VDPRAGLVAVVKTKLPAPAGKRTAVIQLIAIHFTVEVSRYLSRRNVERSSHHKMKLSRDEVTFDTKICHICSHHLSVCLESKRCDKEISFCISVFQ
jgi:hypothetical protein